LAAFALAATVAGTAIGAAAQTSDQAAERARYDALFQTLLERPADLDAMFEFAALAARLGEYDAAISTLERMLIYNADLPRVRLELGALYMRIGADEMARVYLQDALTAPEVPDPVRERIETLLAQIDQRTARNVFAGSVFGGLRYQTNANAGPDSSQVQAFGLDARLDDEFRADDDFNAFLSGSLVHRYNFDSPYGEWWETRLTGYGAWQFDFTDLDIALAEIQTGPRIALNPGEWKGTSLRVYALGNVVDLGRRLLYASVGGGAEVSQVVNDQAIVDLGYAFRYKDYHNSDRSPNADDYTGDEHTLGLTGRYAIDPDWMMFGGVTVIRDDAKTAHQSNWEYGLLAGVRYSYAAPFESIQLPWQVALAVSFGERWYDDADVAVNPNTDRSDNIWQVSLNHSARVTSDISIESQIRYEDQDSNLTNYSYDNWSFTLGVLATF
jgi:hypothetical protein